MTNPIKLPITIEDIITMLPHRYPFLLVDRVVEYVPGQSMTALKNVTINEPFFNGHFPGKPIMPGVLIIEALAQTSCLFAIQSEGDAYRGKLVYFMAIDSAKFRKPVTPGDSLNLHVHKMKQHRNVWKFEAKATVAGEVVTEAILTAMIVDGSHDK